MIFSLERIQCLKILLLYCSTLQVSTLSTSLNATGCKGPPWRILFFGSDDFSLRSLIPLTNEFKDNKKLISKLDVMVLDEETIIAKHALEHRLPILHFPPENDEELKGKYDVGILVSFGEMIEQYVIDGFPLGILNSHPSLLPRWRGASPIPHAIMYGDKETGVSIMKIKADEFDNGDIVLQKRTKIDPHEHTPDLQERLAKDSADLIMSVIKGLPKSLQKTIPQSEKNVTYARKLKQEFSWIEWENMTSLDIYNRHRAISHLWPVSTIWKCYVVKFHDIRINPEPAGTVFPTLAPVAAAATVSGAKKGLHNLGAAPGKPFRKTTPRPTRKPKQKKGGKGQRRGPTTEVPDEEVEDIYNPLNEINGTIEHSHMTARENQAKYVNDTMHAAEAAGNAKAPQQNIGPNGLLRPGLVMYDKTIRALRVMCLDGVQILVHRVTVSSRKTMDGLSFYNGFMSRTKAEDRIFSEYSHFKGANAVKKEKPDRKVGKFGSNKAKRRRGGGGGGKS